MSNFNKEYNLFTFDETLLWAMPKNRPYHTKSAQLISQIN